MVGDQRGFSSAQSTQGLRWTETTLRGGHRSLACGSELSSPKHPSCISCRPSALFSQPPAELREAASSGKRALQRSEWTLSAGNSQLSHSAARKHAAQTAVGRTKQIVILAAMTPPPSPRPPSPSQLPHHPPSIISVADVLLTPSWCPPPPQLVVVLDECVWLW